MRVVAVLRRRPVKIALDVALLVGFVVEFVTRERSFDPRYLVHGWTGIILLAALAAHLGGNWGWVQRVARRRSRDREARLALLNLTFAVLAGVCIVSGLPLWVGWTDNRALVVTHAATGFLSILVMVVHLVWNQRRIRTLLGLRGHGPVRSTAAPGGPARGRAGQRGVDLLQLELLDLGDDGDGGGQVDQLGPSAPGDVGYRADLTLLPRQVVVELGDVVGLPPARSSHQGG